jgi:hypothetical protein
MKDAWQLDLPRHKLFSVAWQLANTTIRQKKFENEINICQGLPCAQLTQHTAGAGSAWCLHKGIPGTLHTCPKENPSGRLETAADVPVWRVTSNALTQFSLTRAPAFLLPLHTLPTARSQRNPFHNLQELTLHSYSHQWLPIMYNTISKLFTVTNKSQCNQTLGPLPLLSWNAPFLFPQYLCGSPTLHSNLSSSVTSPRKPTT